MQAIAQVNEHSAKGQRAVWYTAMEHAITSQAKSPCEQDLPSAMHTTQIKVPSFRHDTGSPVLGLLGQQSSLHELVLQLRLLDMRY